MLFFLSTLLSGGCRAPDAGERTVDAPPPGNSNEAFDAVESRLSTLLGSPLQLFGVDTSASTAADFRVGVLLLVADALFRSPDHFDAAPEGYWVGCSEQLGLSFPGCEALVGATNLMNRQIFGAEPPAVWIDDLSDTHLIARTKLDPDPALLLITGSLTKDGTVEVDDLMELPDGAATRPDPDEFAIETVDVQGHVLSRFEGLAIFGDPTDTSEGIDSFDPDFAIITVKIHYPVETTSIRFKKGERVLLEVDPLSGTLRNAIQRVPDRGFLRNQAQRRKTLLQKVEAFEKMLKEGARVSAIAKLDNDIRKHAREWLVDFVNERPGVEFTRSDVLTQIDRVEARLRAQIDTPAAP